MSWYLGQNLKPQGPFSLEEIRLKIRRGEISPQDFLFNQTTDEWKPAFHWRFFESRLFPAFQDIKEGIEAEQVDWVLLREKQEGPYRTLQLREMLRSGQVTADHYIWKPTLSGWVRLRDRVEFQAQLESPPDDPAI